MWRILVGALCVLSVTAAQTDVEINVDASQPLGPLERIWDYFGYDEPNFTYTEHGSKLVGELAGLDQRAVYIRTHFLLATGDGRAGLKWGSTNAYTEDASGAAIYDWTTVDRILDTYLKVGAKPFVEIGFMPKALSRQPDPYQVPWIPGEPNKQYSAGWSYPPSSYAKWGELIYRWVRHEVEKHGEQEVGSWYWEVWNEPDISYWHGTPQEYDQLYDYSAAAVKRALPSARIGGPASTGPANAKAAAFLQQFLQHCDSGTNFASGTTGSPLDFISYHAKGQPQVQDGRLHMGSAKNLRDVESGFQIVKSFPRFAQVPIILSESDPEGCAACSARLYPQNAYRNGELYAVYTAVMIKNILDLAAREKVNIAGMLTWAFEFEDQPYFDGLRTLATNGVDKPVLNVFRMASRMSGQRLPVKTSGGVPLSDLIAGGVAGTDVDALASTDGRTVSILLWNYSDNAANSPAKTIRLNLSGIHAKRAALRRFQIDAANSNAWTVWKNMGSPQMPGAAQYAQLLQAGQLAETETPHAVRGEKNSISATVELPGEAVTLLQISLGEK